MLNSFVIEIKNFRIKMIGDWREMTHRTWWLQPFMIGCMIYLNLQFNSQYIPQYLGWLILGTTICSTMIVVTLYSLWHVLQSDDF